MLTGISGSLVSQGFLTEVWPSQFAAEMTAAQRSLPSGALLRWWRRTERHIGPRSSARAVLDQAAMPFLEILGYTLLHVEPGPGGFTGVIGNDAGPLAVLLVLPWADGADDQWRQLQRAARTAATRWALVMTGRRLRIVDAARTWTRRTLDFDLGQVVSHERGVLALWALARAAALEHGLDRVTDAADTHAVAVCDSLGDGVLDALGALTKGLATVRVGRSDAVQTHFDQALTLVYRILFLLFAEARGVVPTWHRVYREAYTIDALYRKCAGNRTQGLWDALVAISRLAHSGCRAGDLRVTPFNGRLFSPTATPVARWRLSDNIVREALLALTTVRAPGGRRRIAYGDLGVEQLGAVYERVLEYEPLRPPTGAPAILSRTSAERKATGSFYTPRSITEFLVRRTLHPLVEGRSADDILSLRIVDPAMGSGAFLVAACRYLARAAARARVAHGEWTSDEATRERHLEMRREVAQRCLYGVDSNATAVQLARLSLWLTTLAVDRPLTFLDHHLATGDSLIGARLEDLARQPSASRHPPSRSPLPLFASAASEDMAATVLPDRYRIAEEPGDTLDAVRVKERMLAQLTAPGTPLERWKRAADLWCAGWFWPDRRLTPAIYNDLLAAVLGGHAALAPALADAWLAQAESLAGRERAFHWHLEFPEVFFARDGRRRLDGGFDAVIGNPPWDVLRSDLGTSEARQHSRATQQGRLRFFRSSGTYRHQSAGHANRYQLFVERALQLIRPGGRIGLILPSGLATDHGSAALRRTLFDSVHLERLFGFTNRDRIFPIHRDMRFMLLTATAGGQTERVACRFGLRDPGWLDTLPDGAAEDPVEARPIVMSRELLHRWDPERLSIPELESPRDLDILAQVSVSTPPLGDAKGWQVRFGRELNATDDRHHFLARRRVARSEALPVVEGKHLEPFRVRLERTTDTIRSPVAASLIDRATTFDRERIAYRDVASATNRLTLIAAILPANTISTHTLFCLKTPLGTTSQYCLLGLLNSLVANYLVRLQVTTHVTASLMARLPVPKPAGDSRAFRQLAALARDLERKGVDEAADAYVELNMLAARLYALSIDQYTHVLSTFPLLPVELRERCLRRYLGVMGGGRHGE